MLLYMLMLTSILMNISLPLMFHPLTITLIIIIQTIINCMIMAPISNSFWFSYIMILIFLGGMLVLFIYITSLTSNESFKMPIKFMLIWLMLMLIMFIIKMFYPTYITMFMNYDSIDTNQLMNNKLSMNLIQIYNYPSSMMTILTIIYLLITMIVIVKITKIQEGPLRKIY